MKKIFYSIMAIAALVSCSKSETAVDNEIRFNLGYPATKATDSAFEAGDAVSVYAVEYNGGEQMPLQIGGNFINNERVAFNGTSWASARTLYWGSNACDFYALYPYQETFTSVDSHPFSVAADQSGEGYEASDLLFSYAENVSRTDGSVILPFRHIMSKLVVNIVKGPKFEGDIPDDIVAHVYNTVVDCKLNLTTGSVEKDGLGTRKTITMNKFSNEHFEAVLVPQNIEKKTPLVELTMGGIAYLLDYSLSFRAGYVHTINITLNTSPDQEMIEISIDAGQGGWQ